MFVRTLTPTMDDGAEDAENKGSFRDAGNAGLGLFIPGSIAAPSAYMPAPAPRVPGVKVANYAPVNEANRDPMNEGDGGDDKDDMVAWVKIDQNERQQKLRDSQKPKQYGPADRVLSDDVFRELIESIIRDFEEEHAHIDKHYTSLGSRSSFANVKCSPHAVQVISDSFEDFLMKLLRRAHVFFSARVRSSELLDDLTLKANTFGPDHRMLINMRICNEIETKRKRQQDMLESVQKQREEEDAAAAEDDAADNDLQARLGAQRVEQKKANSKIVTMEEVNKERELMSKKGGQGLLVKNKAVKALESAVVPLELEKIYSDTDLFFKKISEHALSGQQVSLVHEIQAEIKKSALSRSKLQESEWRALRLDDIIPVMDAEPTLRRKMVTLYGHELVQAKNNSIVQEELKRRRDAATFDEEKEDQWNLLKKICSAANGTSEDHDTSKRLEDELTLKYTQGKLVLPAAKTFYEMFIAGGGGKGSMRKVHPAEHRSSSITSMLSSKVSVQRLPLGVSNEDVNQFLAHHNIFGLKTCQFDMHGTNAVLEFHMPKFAQECVTRLDNQRMRISDPETLKVSLFEAIKLEPGNVLIAEQYESDVSAVAVSQLCRNVSGFKGTCKPPGEKHCFVEFVDPHACASALNKFLALGSQVYFRYVSESELSGFSSVRQIEKDLLRQMMDAPQRPPQQPAPKDPSTAPILSSSSKYSVGTFLQASSIPGDLNIDELRRRMSVYSGCLSQTLKTRPSRPSPDQSSSLRIQEFQVQFTDEATANECHRVISGRPFIDDRPEFGHVRSHVRTITQEDIDKANGKQRPLPPPAQTPIVRDQNLSASSFSISSAPVIASTPNPLLPNAEDMITFLVANNIPLISNEEITQVFMSFSGMLGSKVDIQPDAKNPRICSVRVKFVDLESAQRCWDALKGKPFSPHHDIGAVQGIKIRQVSKEQMQRAIQERKEKDQQQKQMQHMPPPLLSVQMPQQAMQHLQQQQQQPRMPQQIMQPMQYATPAVSQPMSGHYAQPLMHSYQQPPEMPQQQQIMPDTQHISTAPNSQSTLVALPLPSNNKKQATEVLMMQQGMQPSHGQPHQVMQPYHGGMPHNMQPQPQLMMMHNMMPPPPQPVQYYQQQPIQLQQQQQYIQIAPQQMQQQQVHHYPQAQHMPLQYTTVQHIPVPQYQYQMQQPAMQYPQAASPTAAELQRLDDEERENQERMKNLLKKAGQR